MMSFIERYKDAVYARLAGLDKWEKRKLALMGLERQLNSYCDFADKRSWNRSREYRELFDLLWDAVLRQAPLTENVWYLHEKIKPENLNTADVTLEINPTFSNIFAGNVEEFINTLVDDEPDEEAFLLLFIDYILCFLHEQLLYEDYEDERCVQHPLVQKEIACQSLDLEALSRIMTLEEAAIWRSQASSALEPV